MSSAATTPGVNGGAARAAVSIKICAGTGCVAGGSLLLVDAFRKAIEGSALEGAAQVGTVPCLEGHGVGITGCHGFCAAGPLVKIGDDGLMYCQVAPADVAEIVARLTAGEEPVERLLFENPADHRRCRGEHDIPFFKKQVRTALARCGEVDPEDIDDYIGRGGYASLTRVVKDFQPAAVIEEIKKSGLQGRGGAGFPTGLKWQFVAEAPGTEKYVVCNGDEGDPGAFMDRSVMEGDPHAVLEGMAIAAFAVGARRGFLYVRAEYPLAVERLRIALGQARERGLLGPSVAGSSHAFDVTIVEGAGAFVCGEETALLNSIEGKRGMPRPRPPYPAISGLWGKPTLINNVETYANIASIIASGAASFAAMGTKLSKGTKTFALTGKVNNIGLVEVPMGISLREIIFDIGGGIPNGRQFKAAQTGGPSGGCIPASHLDTPIDYRTLQDLGSMMGSGGLVVVDDSTCMVKLAKFFMEFCVDESCGKCPPCRIGTKVMLEILDRICDGRGEPGDVDRLKAVGEHMRSSALCGLGQTAPNPTLSTIHYFRHEYEAHIADHKCPAAECYKLVRFFIEPDKCGGCTLCAKNCPVSAISGKVKQLHVVDDATCIHCGACLTVCPSDAVRTL